MPGFTSECQSGIHNACTSRDCRCSCHPWTQELIHTPVKKADPTGGIRRQLPEFAVAGAAPLTELRNTCPKCGSTAKPTDVFCRRDGEKLLLGKQCLGCHAPQEPHDEFCWQCGLKSGEKPPVEVLPEEQASEDPILRILRERNITLKETTVR
jgi:hypothetical protein